MMTGFCNKIKINFWLLNLEITLITAHRNNTSGRTQKTHKSSEDVGDKQTGKNQLELNVSVVRQFM